MWQKSIEKVKPNPIQNKKVVDIIRTPADFSTLTKPHEINEEIAGMYDEAFFADSVLLFIVFETTPEPTYTVTKITAGKGYYRIYRGKEIALSK